jgi:hypothetical protein
VQNPKSRHFKPFEFFDHTGSKQLPLDKPVPRNATKEQARDYLARVRKQQPYVLSGSFGTRF